MPDAKEFEEYQVSDKDIEAIIRYLKIEDPDNATPENAVAFLEHYAQRFHELGHVLSDEDMQKLYKKFRNDDLSS